MLTSDALNHVYATRVKLNLGDVVVALSTAPVGYVAEKLRDKMSCKTNPVVVDVSFSSNVPSIECVVLPVSFHVKVLAWIFWHNHVILATIITMNISDRFENPLWFA